MKGMEVLDIKILRAVATLRTFYPQGENDKQRVPLLVADGYRRPVRRPVHASYMPPPSVGYELTPEGRAALME
jgi:hypothetical protein